MGGFGSGDYKRVKERKKCVEECFSLDSFKLAREPAERISKGIVFDNSWGERDRFSVFVRCTSAGYNLWAMILDEGIDQNDVWTAMVIVANSQELKLEFFAEANNFWGKRQPLPLPFAQIFAGQIAKSEVTRGAAGSYSTWFLCPEVNNGHVCARRCRKLYWSDGSFACRKCHRLAYKIQQKDKFGRLLAKAERIRWQVLDQLSQQERDRWKGDNSMFPPPPPHMTHIRYDTLYDAWRITGKKVAQMVTAQCNKWDKQCSKWDKMISKTPDSDPDI